MLNRNYFEELEEINENIKKWKKYLESLKQIDLFQVGVENFNSVNKNLQKILFTMSLELFSSGHDRLGAYHNLLLSQQLNETNKQLQKLIEFVKEKEKFFKRKESHYSAGSSTLYAAINIQKQDHAKVEKEEKLNMNMCVIL